MKKFFLFLLMIMLFLSCALNKKSDEASIDDLIYSLQDIIFLTYDADEETTEVKTQIEPFLWYRTKSEDDSISYDIDIDVIGDSAYATVKIIFPGDMNLWYISDSDTVHIAKPYIDTIVKYCFFKKDTTLDYHNGWRLVKMTDTYIYTKNPSDIKIDSIKIFADGIIDTMIKMDTSYFGKNEIISLPSGTLIQLSVFSTDTTSRFFVHSYLKRKEMVYSSENLYTQTFRVPFIKKTYRMLIDGFTKQTLEDDSVGYSTYGIIFPYIVE
ncbi:MAG: hypothetical protein WHT27_05200 [candidate division WOR-3 bacterium]